MYKVLAVLALTLACCLAVFPSAEGQGTTPKMLRPLNLTVNTPDDDDEPHVGDNGKTLYWTVTKMGGKDELWSVNRSEAAAKAGNPWPSRLAKPLEDAPSTKGDIRGVFATARRYPRFLYFAAKDAMAKNFDLYVAVAQNLGSSWATPEPVMNVNTPEDEMHPWLTEDGLSLYFSRKTKNGWRVFVSTREKATGSGGWGAPTQVGLPKDFHHATLTPKGDEMYVQGRVDEDRWALFVSRRRADEWTRPALLETLNNPKAPKGDMSPSLSRDGKYLYFASDRPGAGAKGGLDLYSIATAELARKR